MKNYIDAKCNVFTEYMSVPDELQGEYQQLCDDMHALGEGMTDFNLFEQQFVSSGLSERYNSLLARCTPKAVKMTAEDKKKAIGAYKEEINAKAVAGEIAAMAVTELKQEAIAKRREKMIEDGVFDDYTRATNKMDAATRAGKFLFKKFKK